MCVNPFSPFLKVSLRYVYGRLSFLYALPCPCQLAKKWKCQNAVRHRRSHKHWFLYLTCWINSFLFVWIFSSISIGARVDFLCLRCSSALLCVCNLLQSFIIHFSDGDCVCVNRAHSGNYIKGNSWPIIVNSLFTVIQLSTWNFHLFSIELWFNLLAKW